MTTAAPERPDQWEEYVNGFTTAEDFLKAFNSGEAKETLIKYGQSTHPDIMELRAQLAEQGQLAIKSMLERNGVEPRNRLDMVDKAKREGFELKAYYSDEAPGSQLDGKFKSAGHFFKTGIAALAKHRDGILESNPDAGLINIMDYGTIEPSSGGFLVPEEVRSDILTRALEFTVVRPRAQVVPMPSGRMSWPVTDFTTEQGEVYGGMTAYWVPEGEEIPETEGKFAMLRLLANKLAALANCPNELLKSAPAFNAWLMTNMPRVMGHNEDLAFIKGNGVGKPLGAFHADNPALITVNKESGQPANTITWNNILAMVARMLPESLQAAEWFITPDALPEVMTMAMEIGTGGSAMMATSAIPGGPVTLFGRPIHWLRKAPGTLGTKGDVTLADLSNYVIGDTQAMSLESSSHQKFSSDRTLFRAVQRMDGQPGMLSALTPENGGPTLSSYVQIETRA